MKYIYRYNPVLSYQSFVHYYSILRKTDYKPPNDDHTCQDKDQNLNNLGRGMNPQDGYKVYHPHQSHQDPDHNIDYE